MAKISTDGRVAVLHPRENLFRTASLSSAAADTAIYADGCSSFTLTITGTFVATALVEGSNDGSNWFTVPILPYNAASTLWVVSAAAVGQWTGQNPGWSQLRVRVSAWTSGTVAYTLAASNAAFLGGDVANSVGTATGGAAATVTLTLVAPGAGLRQYLTGLRIERHTSALLTAGTTPVIVTTTNLPGSLAFSIPADAAAQGSIYRAVEDFARPLAASAQNTAVTIVAPATTAVIWRLTAYYRVAP
jgi:hypothetical protein